MAQWLMPGRSFRAAEVLVASTVKMVIREFGERGGKCSLSDVRIVVMGGERAPDVRFDWEEWSYLVGFHTNGTFVIDCHDREGHWETLTPSPELHEQLARCFSVFALIPGMISLCMRLVDFEPFPASTFSEFVLSLCRDEDKEAAGVAIAECEKDHTWMHHLISLFGLVDVDKMPMNIYWDLFKEVAQGSEGMTHDGFDEVRAKIVQGIMRMKVREPPLILFQFANNRAQFLPWKREIGFAVCRFLDQRALGRLAQCSKGLYLAVCETRIRNVPKLLDCSARFEALAEMSQELWNGGRNAENGTALMAKLVELWYRCERIMKLEKERSEKRVVEKKVLKDLKKERDAFDERAKMVMQECLKKSHASVGASRAIPLEENDGEANANEDRDEADVDEIPDADQAGKNNSGPALLDEIFNVGDPVAVTDGDTRLLGHIYEWCGNDVFVVVTWNKETSECEFRRDVSKDMLSRCLRKDFEGSGLKRFYSLSRLEEFARNDIVKDEHGEKYLVVGTVSHKSNRLDWVFSLMTLRTKVGTEMRSMLLEKETREKYTVWAKGSLVIVENRAIGTIVKGPCYNGRDNLCTYLVEFDGENRPLSPDSLEFLCARKDALADATVKTVIKKGPVIMRSFHAQFLKATEEKVMSQVNARKPADEVDIIVPNPRRVADKLIERCRNGRSATEVTEDDANLSEKGSLVYDASYGLVCLRLWLLREEAGSEAKFYKLLKQIPHKVLQVGNEVWSESTSLTRTRYGKIIFGAPDLVYVSDGIWRETGATTVLSILVEFGFNGSTPLTFDEVNEIEHEEPEIEAERPSQEKRDEPRYESRRLEDLALAGWDGCLGSAKRPRLTGCDDEVSSMSELPDTPPDW